MLTTHSGEETLCFCPHGRTDSSAYWSFFYFTSCCSPVLSALLDLSDTHQNMDSDQWMDVFSSLLCVPFFHCQLGLHMALMLSPALGGPLAGGAHLGFSCMVCILW